MAWLQFTPRYTVESNNCVRRAVANVETLIHNFTPTSKRSTTEWTHPRSLELAECWPHCRGPRRVMLLDFLVGIWTQLTPTGTVPCWRARSAWLCGDFPLRQCSAIHGTAASSLAAGFRLADVWPSPIQSGYRTRRFSSVFCLQGALVMTSLHLLWGRETCYRRVFIFVGYTTLSLGSGIWIYLVIKFFRW